MSLKKNILTGFCAQIYISAVGIVMLPIYARQMGIEAYGLVGFFALMQPWFQLLDVGLTPTLARETARFHSGETSGLNLRLLLRSLEVIFLGLGCLGAVCLILGANVIAERWLTVMQLPHIEVVHSITLMALIIALRWIGELYRGVITGFERLAWLGGFNAVIATGRFVMVVPFMLWFGSSVGEFFFFQLCVAIIEAVFLLRKAYALLPVWPPDAERWSWRPLRNVMGFSLAMASASLVWLAASQTDKILLSGLLSLSDYGWFSLATVGAGGVLMLTSPIVTVLMPRLTALHAQGDEKSLIGLYRRATQWVGLLVWPACGVLACQADHVLFIWTGDTQLAAQATSTLRLYALGNGVMAVGALPYYLQFAKGQLRLHVQGTILFVVMSVPLLVWATNLYGATGAGWVWLIVNLVYFVLWVPLVHRRFASGLHLHWLLQDVVPIAMLSFCGSLASLWLSWPEGRFMAGLQLLLISVAVMALGAMGSSWMRAEVLRWWLADRLMQKK